MNRTLVVVCLLAALLVPGIAAAQAPSPEALAAARELVAASRAADQMKAILPALIQALKPAIVQGRPQVEQDYDAIAPVLAEGMSSRLGDLTEQVVVIYATSFTVAEMKDVTAFYQGPSGQKLLEKTPAVLQQTLAAGQQFGNKIAGELQARFMEELRKRGNKL